MLQLWLLSLLSQERQKPEGSEKVRATITTQVRQWITPPLKVLLILWPQEAMSATLAGIQACMKGAVVGGHKIKLFETAAMLIRECRLLTSVTLKEKAECGIVVGDTEDEER